MNECKSYTYGGTVITQECDFGYLNKMFTKDEKMDGKHLIDANVSRKITSNVIHFKRSKNNCLRQLSLLSEVRVEYIRRNIELN